MAEIEKRGREAEKNRERKRGNRGKIESRRNRCNRKGKGEIEGQ